MIKKLLLALLGLVVVAVVLARMFVPGVVEAGLNVNKPHDPWPVSDEAAALHKELLVGDWHTDSLLWDRNLLKRENYGHVDFPRLREGNVTMQVFTAVTKSPKGQNYDSNSADAPDNITTLTMVQTWPLRTWDSLYERALYQVERLQGYEEEAPTEVRVIETAADIDAVMADRKAGGQMVAAMMGMEGAHPLEGKIDNLDRLYEAGYRMIGLQHFFDNELGGSLHGQSNAGLTDFGRVVVKRALAKNMIIDVAHSSPAVVEETLDIVANSAPVVVSHTGIHGHCKVKRNIPDALMKRIAQTGGVIAIGYWEDVTCDDTPAGIVRTIRAAIDLVGEDHVSLGSDYDGSIAARIDTSELASLTHEMLEQDFTETEIRKVMGENQLRVWRAVIK